MAINRESLYRQANLLIQDFPSGMPIQNDAIYPHWVAGHNLFWYVNIQDGRKRYWLVNADSFTRTCAFDHHVLAKALSEVVSEDIDPDMLPIVVTGLSSCQGEISFGAFQKNWIYDSVESIVREVEFVSSSKSPDGQSIVFIRDFNLWRKNLITGEEVALTTDGVPECAYGLSLGAPDACIPEVLWSPDSKRLLTVQLDISKIPATPIIQHVPLDGSIRPKVDFHKVSYPGDEQCPTYRLISIDFENGTIQDADYGPLVLGRVGAGFFSSEKLSWWAMDSKNAYFIDIVRFAKTINVVRFDTTTGHCVVIACENSPTTARLSNSIFEPPLIVPIPETEELIIFSERTGWGHLYLYDLKTGNLKYALTEGQWVVRNILNFSQGRRELVIQTSGRNVGVNPYYKDICVIDIDSLMITNVADDDYDYVVYEPRSYHV